MPGERFLNSLYPEAKRAGNGKFSLGAGAPALPPLPPQEETSAGALTYGRLMKIVKRPPVMIALGVAFSVCAGLGLLTAGYVMSAPSQANEPVAMAPEPIQYESLDTREMLALIDQTTQKSQQVLNEKANDTSLDEESALGNLPNPLLKKAEQSRDEAVMMMATTGDIGWNPIPVASGRPDPFAPLVRESVGDGAPAYEEEKEKDLLEDVVYSGFIKDVNSAKNTAILKVAGSSVIKKAGDSFSVDGYAIAIKSVSSTKITLKVKGVTRTLPISVVYQTASASTGGSSASSASASSSAGTSSGSSSGAKSSTHLELEELE